MPFSMPKFLAETRMHSAGAYFARYEARLRDRTCVDVLTSTGMPPATSLRSTTKSTSAVLPLVQYRNIHRAS